MEHEPGQSPMVSSSGSVALPFIRGTEVPGYRQAVPTAPLFYLPRTMDQDETIKLGPSSGRTAKDPEKTVRLSSGWPRLFGKKAG